MPGGVAHVFQVVVLAAGPDALLGTGGPGVGTLFFPQKHRLNCTIPALVNSRVGSPAGTREELATRVWPWDSK